VIIAKSYNRALKRFVGGFFGEWGGSHRSQTWWNFESLDAVVCEIYKIFIGEQRRNFVL